MTVEKDGAAGGTVADALSLADVAILGPLPEEERQRVATQCAYRRVAAGDVLLARYGVGSAVLFILTGRVRVVHRFGREDEVTIATVAAGETIGEISAVDGGVVSASIVAELDCVVAVLPNEAFRALIARRGEVALALLRRWAAIIRELDDKVSFIASVGPMQRLCSELVRLARVEAPASSRWLVPELPGHQELAIRAQMTRESVAQSIAELIGRGIVERRTRALHILDYPALKDMARRGPPAPPLPTAAMADD